MSMISIPWYLIFLQNPFDYVFHYAAVVGVQRTLENPLLVLNDIEGIKNILKLSSYSKVKRIYFSSSSEVYGEPIEFPQNENTTPLNWKLPYSIVKNLGEAISSPITHHKVWITQFLDFSIRTERIRTQILLFRNSLNWLRIICP